VSLMTVRIIASACFLCRERIVEDSDDPYNAWQELLNGKYAHTRCLNQLQRNAASED
jgi:hypothetical protein